MKLHQGENNACKASFCKFYKQFYLAVCISIVYVNFIFVTACNSTSNSLRRNQFKIIVVARVRLVCVCVCSYGLVVLPKVVVLSRSSVSLLYRCLLMYVVVTKTVSSKHSSMA